MLAWIDAYVRETGIIWEHHCRAESWDWELKLKIEMIKTCQADNSGITLAF